MLHLRLAELLSRCKSLFSTGVDPAATGLRLSEAAADTHLNVQEFVLPEVLHIDLLSEIESESVTKDGDKIQMELSSCTYLSSAKKETVTFEFGVNADAEGLLCLMPCSSPLQQCKPLPAYCCLRLLSPDFEFSLSVAHLFL